MGISLESRVFILKEEWRQSDLGNAPGEELWEEMRYVGGRDEPGEVEARVEPGD